MTAANAMSTRAALLVVVAAVVLIALARSPAPVRGDNGYATDYSECFALNTNYFQLPAVCINFHLDTCHRALQFNLTYDGTTAFNVEITDIAGYSQCFTPAGASFCRSCVQFVSATTVLTPSYANLCPEVVTTCTVAGVPLRVGDNKLGCLSLGVNCAEQPTCSACMSASTSCGWCGNYTAGTCMIQGVSNGGADGPYCASCQASHSTSWTTSAATCPVNPNASETAESWAARNKGLIAGVSVGGFVLFGGVAALCFVRRRRASRDAERRGAVPLADMGDSPGDGPAGVGAYSVPVVDTPMPAALQATASASSSSASASASASGTVEPSGAGAIN